MDFEALSQKGKISLLTLPKTDLVPDAKKNRRGEGGESSKSASSFADGKTGGQAKAKDETLPTSSQSQLVLLQLPTGWTPNDIKGSRFVAAPSSSSSSSKQHASAASLVVESKRQSFDVHRVETSNVLVLVPPLPSDGGNSSTTSNKRYKVTEDGKTLVPTPARLLSKAGVSGASFLELRNKVLSMQHLMTALSRCVFDPYRNDDDDDNHNSKPSPSGGVSGRTVESLARELQVTEYETRKALQRIRAFPWPRGDDPASSPSYGLLAEEAKLMCYDAILWTLSEVDEYEDYAFGESGVDADGVVAGAVQRMSDDERFDGVEHVVRYCLDTLSSDVGRLFADASTSNGANSSASQRLQLDLREVAVCVARRLFHKQGAPWEEDLFMSRWQSELPGTGSAYQVDPSMLRGVAVDIRRPAVVGTGDEGTEETFWKYLPVESLPIDPSAGFCALFSTKEKWMLDDLVPYLNRWGDETIHSDMLLRFTKVVTEERDGVTFKMYARL